MRYFLRGDGPLRRGPPAAFDVGRAWYFLDANISSVVFVKEGGLSVSLLVEDDAAEEEEPDGDLEVVGGGFTRLRSDCGSVAARDETLVDFVFASRWPVLRVVIQLSAALETDSATVSCWRWGMAVVGAGHRIGYRGQTMPRTFGHIRVRRSLASWQLAGSEKVNSALVRRCKGRGSGRPELGGILSSSPSRENGWPGL